jgi:hypothetical protein
VGADAGEGGAGGVDAAAAPSCADEAEARVRATLPLVRLLLLTVLGPLEEQDDGEAGE